MLEIIMLPTLASLWLMAVAATATVFID